MKPVSAIVSVLLLIVAVIHVLRIVFQWQVTIGSATVPMWVSVVGAVITAVLAVLLWREGRK